MENNIEIKNSKTKKARKPRQPRQPKKVTEKKKKTNKVNKNKNTQSIKINISSSGGLGGSGGGGTPSIPIPIQTFSRSERIGENVDVSNLLRRIENQQQSAFNNLMNQQTAFNNILTPITQRINRDDVIDEAETINNGIDGDFEYDDSFKNKLIFPMEQNPLASNRASPANP